MPEPDKPTALEAFIETDCNEDLAALLKRKIEDANGTGYDGFNFNMFDVELFYAEDRVTVSEALDLGHEAVEVSVTAFLAALPDVPAAAQGTLDPPRRVIIPPPPEK